MKALFCVVSEYYITSFPPAIDVFFGQQGFGYWIYEGTEAPLENTVMVVVNTTEEILDEMAAQDENWKYVKDLPDEEEA